VAELPDRQGLLALAALAAVVGFLLRRTLWHAAAAPLAWRSSLAFLLAWGLAVGATLRWVDTDLKNFSASDAANDLAGNGLYEFFAANHRNELSYERHYAVLPPARISPWCARRSASPRRRGRAARRPAAAGAAIERRAGERREPRRGVPRCLRQPARLTPNLDRLARESLWFSGVYATGNRTVRGLEALSLALPPTPGQSIVRRPNNDKLFSLGQRVRGQGYAVLFAYGGYGYFDNMNAFLRRQRLPRGRPRAHPAARIKFENVWGVADEHLFDQVLDEIDREHSGRTAVFAHVMTTSNHRPYTYPAGRIDIPSGHRPRGAVKYTDYAIGHFLEQARHTPGSRDTVFVITADHGANARGTMRIPVDKYLIPLFVYSPQARRAGARGPAHVADRHRADAARPARFRYYTQVSSAATCSLRRRSPTAPSSATTSPSATCGRPAGAALSQA
jgi:hypothetical protein